MLSIELKLKMTENVISQLSRWLHDAMMFTFSRLWTMIFHVKQFCCHRICYELWRFRRSRCTFSTFNMSFGISSYCHCFEISSLFFALFLKECRCIYIFNGIFSHVQFAHTVLSSSLFIVYLMTRSSAIRCAAIFYKPEKSIRYFVLQLKCWIIHLEHSKSETNFNWYIEYLPFSLVPPSNRTGFQITPAGVFCLFW